jgi:PAS domain S-box-containing protein
VRWFAWHFSLRIGVAFSREYIMSKPEGPTLDIETEVASEERLQISLVKMGALEDAILTSANFSIIATDEKGVIQLFNVGAESMLGYAAEDVLNRITPADISDPQEVIARAAALSAELETTIAPGFDALVFKASRGIEDIYELTYIRKDGSRFPVLVSVTALRDEQEVIIGYLLIGTDNTARKQIEAEREQLLKIQENTNKQLQQANSISRENEEKLAVTLHSIGDGVIATDASARVTLLNPLAERLTGWTQADARGRQVTDVFKIINKETRKPARIPVADTLAKGTTHGLANHTVLVATDGSECDIADSCAPIRDRDGKVIGAVLVFRDVTGEYAAAQSLRDSNELIQTVLNTVGDGIITILASDGVIATVNPAADRMFGYRPGELMGKNLSMLVPELDQNQSNNTLEYYSASDEQRAAGLGREVMGRYKSGGFFHISLTASEMWLGGQRYFSGIFRDITARKEAEEALIKAGALQKAIFNSANFSSIATDAKGVIQIFNVGAERMLGYTAAEVMDKSTPADISDPQEMIARAKALSLELGTEIKPGFEALVFKATRGIEDIYALTYIRKDGSRFPALVSVTALRDAKKVIIGYLLIGTDNTARTLVEAERAQLYEKLQDKNAELEAATLIAEKANLAKSEFLSSMSHELRTPLNAILGFAQLLESGAPAPTTAQLVRLQQIIKAGWYLLDLINEILDLAVIESGRLVLSRESVSLIDVMHECQAMIEPQAQKRDIQLSFMPFDTGWYANADHTRVKQVLINLLSNAIKYNREHGSIIVECTETDPERIRISIKDSGNGLSPEDLAHLFQPFNRLGQEEGSEEGTGIGLVVTKQLVELMGGNIGVSSKVGVGSEFWFELNRDFTPSLSDAHNLPAELIAKVPGDTLMQSLLYVEDNPANLLLVEQIIAGYPNMRMLSARDGHLGIALARSQRPDVILMDINLPGISGFETLKILRDDPITADIPVLAISANAMPRDIRKGMEAGFLDYLTKPIRVNVFKEALALTLEQAASKRKAKIESEVL